MTIAYTQPHMQSTQEIGTAWDRMVAKRRFYTFLGLVILIAAFVSSVRFSDESNAGHFVEEFAERADRVQGDGDDG
ncbi:phosphonate ABC transporter, permease protein PhnE, partial [Rhizobium ruizarguesonis]